MEYLLSHRQSQFLKYLKFCFSTTHINLRRRCCHFTNICCKHKWNMQYAFIHSFLNFLIIIMHLKFEFLKKEIEQKSTYIPVFIQRFSSSFNDNCCQVRVKPTDLRDAGEQGEKITRRFENHFQFIFKEGPTTKEENEFCKRVMTHNS